MWQDFLDRQYNSLMSILGKKNVPASVKCLNLTFDGLFSDLSFNGGGAQSAPPLFLFVKTIEKVIRLCTVLKKKYLIGSFKDKAIFHVILEIDR